MTRTRFSAVVILTLCAPLTLAAQSISIGLRGTGGMPVGAFAESAGASNTAVVDGAKSGFGYGLDLGVSMGVFGVYVGFDHINFDCETVSCSSQGKYKLQGVAAGLKLSPASQGRFHPYVKGGVTFNGLEGAYGSGASTSLTTDRAPGYEVGVGANVSLGGLIFLTPQLRYVGQNLKAKIPGVSAPSAKSDAINYATFDLGLSFATPFGGRR
ncbi:outer membrane beta-barrel protein [Gemmatimonas sp.]|uniref:outer membrane beta-barrel protein n=1 Tax=Gemmatimonas sp. TaxID=1962908 RepID=UPI00286D8674|nr:outer membrane beta-barrel protein [Gemmatimonas sp.]